ncbi:MAG: tRNA (N6-isopentenyl adenosine(37)-C2)-methylthiotransferase MiaB [Clostridia bacterium]|nr:tRNA (N6-isopentenyl adenosine(37)-C2)-methylthiotransferase MiaB [Clostridia bacterium]MDY2930218.1 tRNA (N6-isopentenyl adenosine(37)-C2)-methylthiotransferase MiaB [Clostridiaceae bacterium]
MSQNERVISPELLAAQQEYAQQVRQIYHTKLGRQPLACAVTFGCQQNEADTELIRGMLTDMGFGFTDDESRADLLIFNTCAIREHAEMRVFGNVGQTSHYKKANPNVIICVCGCMPQQPQVAEKIKNSYPYVDIVFGTHALYRFPQLLHTRLTGGKRVFDISGDEKGVILEGVHPVRKAGPAAWLSIMYGCNNFCAYCIVPYVRGRERSRDPEVILTELRELVDQGYKDITLLGQNVNSYGLDREGLPDFSGLLELCNAVPGEFRLRFMTSHPKDASPRLFDTMAKCEKVCHAIHLPVQCGSDRVLREMNRRYDVKRYLELVDYARKVMPDLTITSDIIVGFPGETEAEFEETVALLERVRFDSLFTFIYSRREGTRAASMPDPVSRAEKQRWFDRLLEVQNRISREKNAEYVGRTLPVLIDGRSEDPNYDLTARTDGFKLVHLRGGEDRIGQFAEAEIDRSSTWALFGKVK